MARKPFADLSAWPSLALEGNLIAPAMIAAIDRRQAPGQSEDDYRIRKGLTVREEISTAFRVGQSHFDAFAKLQSPSMEATRRFVRAFLAETFGFDDLGPCEGEVSLLAGGRVPIVVVPPSDERLDRRSEALSSGRARSPALALQDYLNDRDEALWGLVTNGSVIRLMRDNASLTRPAHVEADLAQIFANEDVASFALLWCLIHRTRFGVAGAREGEAARDRLAAQVETALAVLGTGFLEANPDLAARLKSGEIGLTEWFNELLRLVYRLIFLMVAEDRNLLHPARAAAPARRLYAEGYSLAALRAQCARAASWDRHHDRYEGVRIVFRALARGEPKLGLPALGGLFDAHMLPHIGTARLSNRAFMEALWRLSWLTEKTGMAPVNWRAMETEELGSVYESLLELQPQLGPEGKSLVFASELSETKGNQRKTTGSYYTPDSLVQALLDTALDPVLDRTEAEADDPAAALLALSVIDPACGSGHFLLAAARRIATRLARIRAQGTPSLADFRHALRDVARCCLYGVDLNPMAVELTRVALWIETVDPGLPLGFFDAQIRCGNSLFGVFDMRALEGGIPDAAYKPLTGDDKETAKHFLKRNKDEKAGQGSLDFAAGGGSLPAPAKLAEVDRMIRALPEDTLEQIAKKEQTFGQLRSGRFWHSRKLACDLWCAAFLAPKTGGVPANRNMVTIPTSAHVFEALGGRQLYGPLAARADALSHGARAFHWPLEFPDIMAGGGFDVVLGNPPWEQIEVDPVGFFGIRYPEFSLANNKAQKDRIIASIEKSDPRIYSDFESYSRGIWCFQQFIHESGRFPTSSFGRLNTAPLFTELTMDLSNTFGKVGIIVPTGIATDSFNQKLFNRIFDSKRLARLVDFENRAGLFPAVDSRMKFALLTLGRDEPAAHFAFFLTEPGQLVEPERNFTLSPAEIAAINPNTKTAPVFRSRADAALTAKIYANAPVLIDEGKGRDGNPWGASFQLMFMMGGASKMFRTAAQLAAEGFERDGTDWKTGQSAVGDRQLADSYVPLYEAKMIHQFDHRWASYDGLDASDVTLAQKQHADFEPDPRYWVPQAEIDARLAAKGWTRGWLMGWRDIARATDERTVIASVFPRVAVGHVLPLIFVDAPPEKWAGLLANMCSTVLDYCARQSVGGTHLTYGYLKQFPVLPPAFYTEPRLSFITPKVLELTYTSHSLAPFARDLEFDGPPFAWDEARRARLRAELDAFYARAYGLTRDELRYVLDPADAKGPDYPSETFRVLKEKEIRAHGEYRTRRLVIEAWDRLEADGGFREMGM